MGCGRTEGVDDQRKTKKKAKQSRAREMREKGEWSGRCEIKRPEDGPRAHEEVGGHTAQSEKKVEKGNLIPFERAQADPDLGMGKSGTSRTLGEGKGGLWLGGLWLGERQDGGESRAHGAI